jgi:hypothetical protein
VLPVEAALAADDSALAGAAYVGPAGVGDA